VEVADAVSVWHRRTCLPDARALYKT